MSLYEDNVCDKIQQRADVGKRKYGVTMERDDLSTIEWLVHLQEELMDAAVYVERLIKEFEKVVGYLKTRGDLNDKGNQSRD